MRLLVINVGLAHRLLIYLFVYQPTRTTLGLNRARNETNRVGGVEGPTLGSWVTHSLSVSPSVPTSHPWNKHQTPCKPCTKQDMWNQTWYVPLIPRGHFFPQLYLKTVRGISSLKLFNNAQTHCVYHKHLFTWILYLIHRISGPFVWTPTWLCISQVN